MTEVKKTMDDVVGKYNFLVETLKDRDNAIDSLMEDYDVRLAKKASELTKVNDLVGTLRLDITSLEEEQRQDRVLIESMSDSLCHCAEGKGKGKERVPIDEDQSDSSYADPMTNASPIPVPPPTDMSLPPSDQENIPPPKAIPGAWVLQEIEETRGTLRELQEAVDYQSVSRQRARRRDGKRMFPYRRTFLAPGRKDLSHVGAERDRRRLTRQLVERLRDGYATSSAYSESESADSYGGGRDGLSGGKRKSSDGSSGSSDRVKRRRVAIQHGAVCPGGCGGWGHAGPGGRPCY